MMQQRGPPPAGLKLSRGSMARFTQGQRRQLPLQCSDKVSLLAKQHGPQA